MSKHFPTLEEWLKQLIFEKKNYKTNQGIDGLPRACDFGREQYDYINFMLRTKPSKPKPKTYHSIN